MVAMGAKQFVANSFDTDSDVGPCEPDLEDTSHLGAIPDRRAAQRFLCDYPARVFSGDRSISLHGRVVDISVAGAQVEAAYPQDGPSMIILHELANDEVYECDLCWNAGQYIGVQFVDMFGPEQRRKFLAGHKFCGLRSRREAQRLAQTDAAALIRDEGDQAYWEARRRVRDIAIPNGSTHAWRTAAHWRRVALFLAKRTGH